VLALSPVAYYRLDEVSGTVIADSSGNGHNATLAQPTYAVLGSPSLLPGDVDKSIEFSSAGNTYGGIVSPSIPVANGGAVAFWASIPDNNGNYCLFTWGGDPGLYVRATILTGALRFGTNSGDSLAGADGVGLAPGVPRFIVINGGHEGIYVDGVFHPGTPGNLPGPMGGILSLAGNNLHPGTNAESFSGGLDEFALFDRNLTPTEISNLYNIGNGMLTGTQPIPAAAHVSAMHALVIGAGAEIIKNATTTVLHAASQIAQRSLRSITAGAQVLSSSLSSKIGAAAHISQKDSTSIGAGASITPTIASITIGAAAFVVPAIAKVTAAAGALIGGIATAVLAAGARIRTTPLSNSINTERRVSVYPVERISQADVDYKPRRGA
jgi:hypothetical protein